VSCETRVGKAESRKGRRAHRPEGRCHADGTRMGVVEAWAEANRRREENQLESFRLCGQKEPTSGPAVRVVTEGDWWSEEERMSITIETLANYLGRPVSVLLADRPFNDWKFKRSVERAVRPPLVDYVFVNHGMDVTCDRRGERVNTIFIYANGDRRFADGVEDFPFDLSRGEVLSRLGSPEKSGERHVDPILGEYGPWDRFVRSGYVIHVQYHFSDDQVCMITLMRDDVAP
jgi:hypothetical protein